MPLALSSLVRSVAITTSLPGTRIGHPSHAPLNIIAAVVILGLLSSSVPYPNVVCAVIFPNLQVQL